MTVIAVVATDPGDTVQQWAIPPGTQSADTPIPRGLRNYQGSGAVAALGANDETAVTITLEFPENFNYLPRNILISFRSDDATEEFEAGGFMSYGDMGSTSNSNGVELVSTNSLIVNNAGTLQALRAFRPLGQWRRFVSGPRSDSIILQIIDNSNDTSTAGDVLWWADFWIYDIEQCLRWPVNLQEQLITQN